MIKSGKFSKIICDGAIVATGDAQLSTESRLAAYGEGCFETLRAYCGGFIRPGRHLDRLHRGMRYLGLEIPVGLQSTNEFLNQLKQLLVANDGLEEEVRIRLQVWADDDMAGYRPGSRSARYVISGSVIAYELLNQNNVDHTDSIRHSVKLITSRYRRISSVALPSDVKWSNGINFILAAREAAENNADDALMLTSDGFLSETTIANIFWKTGNTVFTPSDICDLLPGITRALTLDVLDENGYHVRTGEYRPEELMEADTVWLCNSIREWYPVRRIDKHQFAFNEIFWADLCKYLQERKIQEMQYVR